MCILTFSFLFPPPPPDMKRRWLLVGGSVFCHTEVRLWAYCTPLYSDAAFFKKNLVLEYTGTWLTINNYKVSSIIKHDSFLFFPFFASAVGYALV